MLQGVELVRLIIVLLLLLATGWILYRVIKDAYKHAALWRLSAGRCPVTGSLRAFAGQSSAFAGFHNRDLTCLPDGGHPDDDLGLLNWWRGLPHAWWAYASQVEAAAGKPSSNVSISTALSPQIAPCAAQELADPIAGGVLPEVAFQPAPTALEATDNQFYRDLAGFCDTRPEHPNCQGSDRMGDYTRNTLGALAIHPIKQ